MANDEIEPTPALQMRGITKSFGPTIALSDVSITVRPGTVHALVGENGAGKSTLMKILSGVVKPDTGTMELFGQPYSPKNPISARRLGIAMIYQELSLAADLTVEENLTLGIEPNIAGVLKVKKIRQMALDALKAFNHPEIQPQIKVSKLSIAACQLVEIARALVVGCKILVLDEPTSSLTASDTEKLFELVNTLKKKGIAIIYISHFLEEVRKIADEVTVLRDGRVVASNLPPQTPDEELINQMVGRKIEQLFPHSTRTPGKLVLEVENLQGTKKPVSASLKLHTGQVYGIAGLVGAGRSELLRAIFGLEKIKSGKVKVGVYFGPASPLKRWNQGMGFLSENRKEEGLATTMSISENITMSKLHSYPAYAVVRPSIQNKNSKRWIEKLGIKCHSASQKIDELSGGNQQKAALARLLEHNVDILLLDEPTRGIDVAAKAAIYQIIDELACDKISPKAILVVSSYLPELMGICDSISVMCKGNLGPTHNVKDIDEHKLMLEAIGC
ncbi:MAG: sugar ABC transporter [Planctomycetes bacterium GWF2_42_9]|nr:MAG: sugar ABC transporter [Planctomycetes bacterium GWF2_42_9]HAL45406.1 sugar ABC transporter [Phycisphaerales bacterium]